MYIYAPYAPITIIGSDKINKIDWAEGCPGTEWQPDPSFEETI